MTSAEIPSHTLGEIAFGGRTDSKIIRARLESSAAVADARRSASALWSVASAAIMDELVRTAQQLLGAAATDVLAAGYRVNSRLVEAAQGSRATPGVPVPVHLAQHTITVTDAVDIDVRVDELHTQIPVRVNAEFDLDPLTAVVRDGRLISVGDGAAGVLVTLSLADKPVAVRRAHARINVRRTFDPGIAVLGHI